MTARRIRRSQRWHNIKLFSTTRLLVIGVQVSRAITLSCATKELFNDDFASRRFGKLVDVLERMRQILSRDDTPPHVVEQIGIFIKHCVFTDAAGVCVCLLCVCDCDGRTQSLILSSPSCCSKCGTTGVNPSGWRRVWRVLWYVITCHSSTIHACAGFN